MSRIIMEICWRGSNEQAVCSLDSLIVFTTFLSSIPFSWCSRSLYTHKSFNIWGIRSQTMKGMHSMIARWCIFKNNDTRKSWPHHFDIFESRFSCWLTLITRQIAHLNCQCGKCNSWHGDRNTWPDCQLIWSWGQECQILPCRSYKTETC